MAGNNAHVYKVVIVGDGGVGNGGNGSIGGVGKTSYVARLRIGAFSEDYVPTLGVEVHPIRFNTNYGEICFNMWDTAGQERFAGIREGYYIGARGCIVMFDATRESSFDNIGSWIASVKAVVPDIKGVIVCNKCDHPDAEFHHPYAHDISVKSEDNLYAPLEQLARRLTGYDDLVIVE